MIERTFSNHQCKVENDKNIKIIKIPKIFFKNVEIYSQKLRGTTFESSSTT